MFYLLLHSLGVKGLRERDLPANRHFLSRHIAHLGPPSIHQPTLNLRELLYKFPPALRFILIVFLLLLLLLLVQRRLLYKSNRDGVAEDHISDANSP